MSAQDTEAIRAVRNDAAIVERGILNVKGSGDAAVMALGRLVARLEAAERLRIALQEAQGIALNGTDRADSDSARLDAIDAVITAALAAAAPGETTPVGKPPLDVAGILWVAAIDRVPLGERTDWVKATEKRVEAINEARAAPGETEQTP